MQVIVGAQILSGGYLGLAYFGDCFGVKQGLLPIGFQGKPNFCVHGPPPFRLFFLPRQFKLDLTRAPSGLAGARNPNKKGPGTA